MAKRASLSGSLDGYKAEKPGQEVAPAAANNGDDKRRGQTLRLMPEAWRQLKMLALERGIASHALLIEAVNDLFQKNGKPPIA